MNNEITPVVSVVVPARNEEACLASCLQSLVSQTEIAFEIIVVDDASSDHTAEIARSFVSVGAGLQTHPSTDHGAAGVHARRTVTLISAPPLPDTWTGKNNAMCAGAKIAKGKWLLFTDADTVHKPGSLSRAVAEAEQRRAALLSYSPEQEVRGFWEKAVMPVIFAELAVTYPPKKVNDPASAIAAANGQYLLISREAYDAVGGHTKIAGDLLEDVAMARLVKSSGRKIFFRYGGDAVCTHMYRNWSQMQEGWTKNLALLFKHPVWIAFGYLMECFVLIAVLNGGIQTVIFGPPRIPSQSVLLPHYPISDQNFLFVKRWMTAGLILLFVYLLLRSTWRVRRARFSLRMSVISLLGPPVFAYLLIRSVVARRTGAVSWKGRTYGGVATRAMPHDSPHTSSAGAK